MGFTDLSVPHVVSASNSGIQSNFSKSFPWADAVEELFFPERIAIYVGPK
jgi:hypothetical protein